MGDKFVISGLMTEMSYRPSPKVEGIWRQRLQTNGYFDRKMTEMSFILDRWYIQIELPTMNALKQPKVANENLGN